MTIYGVFPPVSQAGWRIALMPRWVIAMCVCSSHHSLPWKDRYSIRVGTHTQTLIDSLWEINVATQRASWIHAKQAGLRQNSNGRRRHDTQTGGTWCHRRAVLTEPVKCPCAQIRGGTLSLFVQLNNGTWDGIQEALSKCQEHWACEKHPYESFTLNEQTHTHPYTHTLTDCAVLIATKRWFPSFPQMKPKARWSVMSLAM